MLADIYRTGGPVDVDVFCKDKMPLIAKALHHCGLYKKLHPSQLTLAEVMTILIYYHLSPYKNVKAYYTRHVLTDLRRDFPHLVSYDRFVALIPRTLIALMLYLAHRCSRSLRTGMYYIDSTSLQASHPKRAHQHRTLKGFAGWGKTSTGCRAAGAVLWSKNASGYQCLRRVDPGAYH
ncbi:transposase [Spirosoma sp.]|uniref:transposase n=2 Tax=unclassified Spirosoma TaxID=2621999 RepID=UPI000AB6C7A5|nr:transposase [Spirosoma sp.]